MGVFSATAIVIGSMVGTGVFTTTGFLIRDVNSNPAVLAVWVLGGVVALCGALAYAELVAALPDNGGEYQLLSRIYHPGVGFVAGFVSLIVGFSAPVAAAAIAFGEYLSRVIPGIPPLTAALLLVALTSMAHVARVSLGVGILGWTTLLHVLLILGVVVGGLPLGKLAYLTPPAQRPFAEAMLSPQLAVGLIYVSFAYSGWNAAAYVAGEVREPQRTVPRALLLGTASVIVLYLALNLVFLMAAPPARLSGVVEVGHVAALSLFGPGAARVASAIVTVGLFTTVVALVMTGPRVYERMGQDYPALRLLASRTGKRGPGPATLLQAALASIMIVTSSFDDLLTYMGFTLSLFAALTVCGVFVLRIREPELRRPYRTWGHPATTVLALALMVWMIVHSLTQRTVTSLVGLSTLAAGAGCYLAIRRRR